MNFIIQAKNGKIGFLSKYNKNRFYDYLKENDGCKFSIKPVSAKVSDEARGYYWGALIPFLKDINPSWKHLTNDQVHEVLKQEFNGFQVTYSNGEVRKYGQSVCSKEIDTPKFQNYLLRITDYVIENYGLQIPDLEEYKKFRDKHFEKEDLPEIDYPKSQGEPLL
jgi:hypothetical protein